MVSRLLVILLVAGAAVAGCVAPGSRLDSSGLGELGATGVTVDDAEALVFSAGNNLSGRAAAAVKAATFLIGHDAGEPTLAIAADGTMFYAAATFDNINTPVASLPRTDILRSKDGGKTWEDATPYLPGGLVRAHPETGDPMVYIDPVTQRVFDIDQRLAVTCYSVTFSDDLGDSWRGAFPACDAPPADHQTILAAKPRMLPAGQLYPNFVFVCWNQIYATACVRSFDGGMTFQRVAPPFEGVDPSQLGPDTTTDLSGVCSALVGHLKADAEGMLYLPKTHCGVPLVATSDDSGLSWSVTRVSELTATHSDPAIALDAAGNAYYTFISEEDSHLYLAVSTDHGATWSEAVDITPPGITAAHLPTIVAGDAGRVALGFVATNDPDGFEQDVAKPDAVWNGYISVIEDALSGVPTVTTTRVNPDDDPLVRGRCGPGRCPGLTDFIDIQMDANGRPWVAFVDACTKACVSDPKSDNDSAAGFVATLAKGPGLLLAHPSLPPLLS